MNRKFIAGKGSWIKCETNWPPDFLTVIYWKKLYIYLQHYNLLKTFEAFLHKTVKHAKGVERSVVRALTGKLTKTCQALAIGTGVKSLSTNASLRNVTIFLMKNFIWCKNWGDQKHYSSSTPNHDCCNRSRNSFGSWKFQGRHQLHLERTDCYEYQGGHWHLDSHQHAGVWRLKILLRKCVHQSQIRFCAQTRVKFFFSFTFSCSIKAPCSKSRIQT